MKKELMRDRCRIMILFLVGFLICNTTVFSQTRKSKTLEEKITIKSGATININHEYGELIIKPSSTNQLKVRLDASVEGDKDQDVEGLLSRVNLSGLEEGSLDVKLMTSPGIKSWSQINNDITIKLDNGDRYKNIQKFHLDLIIEVPNGVNLNLKNKYNNISIEDLDVDLNIENYDGNVQLNNIKGNLKMNLKYGQASINNIGNCDIEMYESTLVVSNAKNFKLNSKYSEHTIGSIDNGEFKIYEGEFTIGNITGNIDVNDKYSDWTIGACKNVTLQSYESDWNIGTMKDLETDSKECEFNIGVARVINLRESYEDDVELGTVEVFESNDSKYLDMNIGTLKKGIHVQKSYECDVKVDKVLSTFEGATLEGKESELKLPLGTKKYQLDIDVVETDLRLNRSTSRKGIFDLNSDDSRILAKEMINGANANSPKIKIKGYELDVNLK